MSSRGGSIGRGLAVLATVVVAAGLAAAPAAAHDELVGTDPADGATVDVAPDQVVLTFAEPAVELGTQVLVTGPDGATASEGSAQLVDSTVVQPLAATRPAGRYQVDWRVTSDDGHVVTGSFAFTASSAATPATAPATTAAGPTTTAVTPSTTAASSPAATATSTSTSATPTAAPSPAPSASTDAALIAPAPTSGAAASTDGRSNLTPAIVLAVLVMVVVAAAIGRNRALRRRHAQAAARDAAPGEATAGGSPTGGPGEG